MKEKKDRDRERDEREERDSVAYNKKDKKDHKKSSKSSSSDYIHFIVFFFFFLFFLFFFLLSSSSFDYLLTLLSELGSSAHHGASGEQKFSQWKVLQQESENIRRGWTKRMYDSA